jgi:hypothetical protein
MEAVRGWSCIVDWLAAGKVLAISLVKIEKKKGFYACGVMRLQLQV